MGSNKREFEIGVIAGVHGVKGEVKIFPYTSDPDNIALQKFYLAGDKKLIVEKARVQGKFIVASINGITDRSMAEKLKGTMLSIPRENATALSEGVYYMADLIGCMVYTGETLLGIVEDIIETGSNDVYSIKNDLGKEILIPAIKSVIQLIDIKAKRIEVILPEGLLDEDYI